MGERRIAAARPGSWSKAPTAGRSRRSLTHPTQLPRRAKSPPEDHRERHAAMKSAVTSASLDQLFRLARTYNEWGPQEVDDRMIHELYELLKWGPTSANSCPARFLWVKSETGKAKLSALAMEMNRPKILAAPLTVIIGHDLDFPEFMPQLFPERGEMLRQMF